MTAPQFPRLLDQVSQTSRLKHFSLKTEKSYTYYIRDYVLFHNKRHPKEMGALEIRQYLSHLATEKCVAASTQNVALNALLFLYREVLNLDVPYIDNHDAHGFLRELKIPALSPVPIPQRLDASGLYRTDNCGPSGMPES